MEVKQCTTLSKNKALKRKRNKRNIHEDSSIIVMAPEFKRGWIENKNKLQIKLIEQVSWERQLVYQKTRQNGVGRM